MILESPYPSLHLLKWNMLDLFIFFKKFFQYFKKTKMNHLDVVWIIVPEMLQKSSFLS